MKHTKINVVDIKLGDIITWYGKNMWQVIELNPEPALNKCIKWPKANGQIYKMGGFINDKIGLIELEPKDKLERL